MDKKLYPRLTNPPRASFFLRRDSEHLAIEIKSKRRFTRDLLSGLLAIGDLDGLVRRVLVYDGSQEMVTQDGIEVWPVRRFLDAVASGELWP